MARMSKLDEFQIAVKARLSRMSPRTTLRFTRTELIMVLGCYYIEGTREGISKEQEAAMLVQAKRTLEDG